VNPFLLGAASYLLGATPTAYWLGRSIHHLDLREHGSGNLGATNAFRVLGWKTALPVMAVDVGKGWFPTAVFPLLVVDGRPEWALLFGGAAVLGHMYSFWVGFRGGKGVATSAGVFLALAPWAFLVALACWLGVALASGFISLASVSAALLLPLAVALTPHQGGSWTILFTVGLSVLVIWAHRSNLARLRRGEEPRISSLRDSAAP